MKVIAKYTAKEQHPDIIDRTYEFYRRAGFRRELMISEPGFRHPGFPVGDRSGNEEGYAGSILRTEPLSCDN